MPAGPSRANVRRMTTEVATTLAPVLAEAGILLFEYDLDGFFLGSAGSCLGGPDPEMEVRAGLAPPDVVRRATRGELVIHDVWILGRRISVRHEPVLSGRGEVERVVATATLLP